MRVTQIKKKHTKNIADSSRTCARFYTMVLLLHENLLLHGVRRDWTACERLFVNIVARDSIDIPHKNLSHFVTPGTDVHDLYIGG